MHTAQPKTNLQAADQASEQATDLRNKRDTSLLRWMTVIAILGLLVLNIVMTIYT